MSINSAKTLNLKDNYVQIINGKAALTQKTHQVSGSDAGRSSPTPSLQSQSSLVESPCKCGSSKPDSPKIALEISEDQDDVFSDAVESVFEDEYPSIQFKALRARQYLRKHYSFYKESDYCKDFYGNWEAVKHPFSFLTIMANLYKKEQGEKDWPLEWEDESALTFFLDKIVANWMWNLSDGEVADVRGLAKIMGNLITVSTDDKDALRRYRGEGVEEVIKAEA
ncbi:uncharacterized protein FOBCDRAFT_202578 [Fusarium oxysporum Fo47]|uniref:uncharacterized protein n=1 Tax=Fusarium oxysporum Fo47 TaxID=660027 RepID=UPI002869AEC1|nr:uncharacterized protein FOBCDRAFT_202578 [Fusarium oxysporum Fo47]QKD55438.2 hypothetical protein FOBCDRAFT_202578 [Fusarium oxysporum Fo47]